jgi:hypothetical protein
MRPGDDVVSVLKGIATLLLLILGVHLVTLAVLLNHPINSDVVQLCGFGALVVGGVRALATIWKTSSRSLKAFWRWLRFMDSHDPLIASVRRINTKRES